MVGDPSLLRTRLALSRERLILSLQSRRMASCTDTARYKPALARPKAVGGVVVGERVGGTLARREKGLGRSGRHVGAERINSRIRCVLDITGLDVKEVLLAPCNPAAVALAGDGDREAVDERDVDACDGEVPGVGAGAY